MARKPRESRSAEAFTSSIQWMTSPDFGNAEPLIMYDRTSEATDDHNYRTVFTIAAGCVWHGTNMTECSCGEKKNELIKTQVK